jgi:hypothetical protein
MIITLTPGLKVSTRCIERFDEAKKDNVLVYDFWSPGRDERREQR